MRVRADPNGRHRISGFQPGYQLVLALQRYESERWRIDGEVLEVDTKRHQIRFLTSLPFGIVGDNRILCTPLDDRSCTLRFG